MENLSNDTRFIKDIEIFKPKQNMRKTKQLIHKFLKVKRQYMF